MNIRSIILMLGICLGILAGHAQDYSVISTGQGKNGGYIVNVTVATKKNPKQTAADLVLEYAVRAVLFDGVIDEDGYGRQKPLVSDPDVAKLKAPFFEAFFREGTYKRYATLVPTSLAVMQNKQIKKWESTGTVTVDKEALLHYLEDSNIIQGFSDLW